jgi:5-methylcytosine-specific restriction endonuclease McrA
MSVADRRYSTARWQRLRRGILRRDGHLCRVQGPRCTGHATTVHDIIPTSQRPDLFWEESNLAASCPACNYGGGRQVAADNGRRRTADLLRTIEQQDQRIQELIERLAR